MALKLILSCAAFLALGVSVPVRANNINVPGDFPDIQTAINNASGGDCILVAPGTYDESLDFLGRAIEVRGNDDPEEDPTIITGRISFVSGEDVNTSLRHVTVQGLDISQEEDDNQGGALLIRGAGPVIADCIIERGKALEGGGVYVEDGSPRFEDCTIQINEAERGGGMFVNAMAPSTASPMLTRCTIRQNNAIDGDADGGGMFALASTPNLVDCVFEANSALDGGGGMYNDDGAVPVLAGCMFLINSAGNDGGGMLNFDASPADLFECIFDGNFAGDDGGAMANRLASNPMITDCVFVDNRAPADEGGAIDNIASSPLINGSTFRENVASRGGAMYSTLSSTPRAFDTIFELNSATSFGGACFNTFDSPAIFGGCTFDANEAGLNGGAIYDDRNASTFSDSTFIDNVAGIDGGGLYCFNALQTVTGCVFTANEAGGNGGGAYNFEGGQSYSGCTFVSNTALGDGGGGLYNLDGDLRVIGTCRFDANIAADGAGVCTEGTGTAVLDCIFYMNNSARGALCNISNSNTVAGTDFVENTATSGGGGIVNISSTVTVVDCRLRDNSAPDGGGMLNTAGGEPRISLTEFCGNAVDDISGAWVDQGNNTFAPQCEGSACPGDINGDGVVDFADILPILQVWGPCGGCPEDLNFDGVVDFADILVILANWGACPIG